MRIITQVILTIFCSLFIGSHLYAAKNEQSLDKIVAIVNDAPITQTELSEAVDLTRKQLAASNLPMPSQEVLRKQVLKQLVDRKLQLQLAEQAGLKVSDTELEQAIQHIASQNNLSVNDLYEQVKLQGMSTTQYRENIRDEILIQQVQQHEVAAKITITPQEVKDFTRSKSWQTSTNKEYHIEDILIGLPDSPTSQQIQDAKKRADALLDKIRHGMSFREASMAESSGNKALQGGDLGWRKLPEIPSAFVDEVIHMQTNGIAGPIQTANGFHIIRVSGVRSIGTQNAPSNKQVEQLLYQRKLEEQVQLWLAKVRGQAYINMNPEN